MTSDCSEHLFSAYSVIMEESTGDLYSHHWINGVGWLVSRCLVLKCRWDYPGSLNDILYLPAKAVAELSNPYNDYRWAIIDFTPFSANMDLPSLTVEFRASEFKITLCEENPLLHVKKQEEQTLNLEEWEAMLKLE